MPTTARQILVTSGARRALNIVLRTLAGRTDKVLVEHPSYPNALDAIRAAGCRLVPVAMPAARPDIRSGAHSGGRPGWDLDAIETALRQQRPAMAYVVPDFHNPTGRLMPDSQRRRLVRAAAEAGTVLVVEQTLRELNLDGVASTPLAAFSPAVVSIGSLSKSHWAGLGTGWIRAEEPLIRALRRRPHHYGPRRPGSGTAGGGPSGQRTRRTAPGAPAFLRDNRDALLDLIAGRLPGWQSERPDGGLSLWCRLPAPISTALAVVAPDFGIRLAA